MIEIRDVTIYYGNFKALDRVSFTARPGKVLGLLGPNGAGKSTVMKCITTQIVPREGTVMVQGVDALKRPVAARRHIGYLPETPPIYAEMEVSEYLDFAGAAHGLSGRRLKERKAWVVEACGLGPVYRKLLSSLSKGYCQRSGLAQCLIHDPDVIILDEPTSGLDPLQILEIRSLIRNLAMDRTIVFSTHILQEAAAISDRVVIIKDGKIVADDSLSGLLGGAEDRVLNVTVAAQQEPFEHVLSGLSGAGDWRLSEQNKDGLLSYEFRNYSPDFWRGFSRAAGNHGIAVQRFYEPPRDLEQVFVELALGREETAP